MIHEHIADAIIFWKACFSYFSTKQPGEKIVKSFLNSCVNHGSQSFTDEL